MLVARVFPGFLGLCCRSRVSSKPARNAKHSSSLTPPQSGHRWFSSTKESIPFSRRFTNRTDSTDGKTANGHYRQFRLYFSSLSMDEFIFDLTFQSNSLSQKVFNRLELSLFHRVVPDCRGAIPGSSSEPPSCF